VKMRILGIFLMTIHRLDLEFRPVIYIQKDQENLTKTYCHREYHQCHNDDYFGPLEVPYPPRRNHDRRQPDRKRSEMW
jgi:hypothetical protein